MAALTDNERNAVLSAAADAICSQKDRILKANSRDLQRMEPANPLYDRLQLTNARLDGIAADMRKVTTLPSP